MHAIILQNITLAIGAGILCLILSEILKIPSILPLLVTGVLLGPSYAHLISPAEIESALPFIIEIGVAIILFEGGLTLRVDQLRNISKPVRNLLTIGALISFVGGSLTAHWVMGMPWKYCFIFGALMIVTGPTVIAPILQRLPLRKSVASILNWESILLDPIGIILAVLIAEFVLVEDASFFITGLKFLKIILVGGMVGIALGWLIGRAVRFLSWISQENLNLMILAGALLSFEFSEMIFQKSGILAVVVAGLVFGNAHAKQKTHIIEFKKTLTSLFISFLFILLAARLNLTEIFDLSTRGWVFLGVMLLGVRPFGVFLSTRNTSLTRKEKIFLSWIAPRGIVAASTASLFALLFIQAGDLEGGKAFENLTYFMIVMTILLQGMTAGLTSRILGLLEKRDGFLIVGSHSLSRAVAHWLQNRKFEVKIIDSNSREIELARAEGLDAYRGNALNASFLQELHLQKIGTLLAFTSSNNLNILVCQLGDQLIAKGSSFQLVPRQSKSLPEITKSIGGIQILPKFPFLERMISCFEDGEVLWSETTMSQDCIFASEIRLGKGLFWPVFKILKTGPIQVVETGHHLKTSDVVVGFLKTAQAS